MRTLKTEVSEAVRDVEGGQIYTATNAGEPVGYAVKVSVGGFGGPLQIMVGFTPDGTVYNTSVISHSETPGLGAKLVDENIAPAGPGQGQESGCQQYLRQEGRR